MSELWQPLEDLRRLMLGLTPPMFIAEVVLRLTLLYATLVIAMRMMGRRMASQLTRNELLALVSLAGAIGPSLQDYKRGRAAGMHHLGQVERMYLEPSGSFCLLARAQPRPGLTLVPEWDQELRAEQEIEADTWACFECGALTDRPPEATSACEACGQEGSWQPAVRA